MQGAINFRILVPLGALLMPAALIAAPPREGMRRIQVRWELREELGV